MPEEPADSKWLERLLQTRNQTREEYYAWCDGMARGFMDIARQLEEMGHPEEATASQRQAIFFKEEMERILEHG
jgi:hypothetical protein